jgi:hypothetical protein
VIGFVTSAIVSPLQTLWIGTPTIESKSHISQRAKTAKCADSNLPGTRNGFSRFWMASRIYSEWAGTY